MSTQLRFQQLDGIVSLSTGSANNDKLVTQGYVDDSVGGTNYWNRITGTPNYVIPATATDNIGETGARIAKGWFSNLEITNYPSVNGTALTNQYLLTTSNVQFNNAVLNNLQADDIEITGEELGHYHGGALTTDTPLHQTFRFNGTSGTPTAVDANFIINQKEEWAYKGATVVYGNDPVYEERTVATEDADDTQNLSCYHARFLDTGSGLVLVEEIHDNGSVSHEKQAGCSVYLGNSQQVAHDTFVKMELDTESWDVQSEYDPTTNYRYTAKESGTYIIRTNLQVNSGIFVGGFVNIYINGAQAAFGLYVNYSGNTSIWRGEVEIVEQLTENDYVEVYTYGTTSTTGNYNLDPGNLNCRLDIQKIA